MPRPLPSSPAFLLGLGLLALSLGPATPARPSAPQPLPKDALLMKHATGTFEVKLQPQTPGTGAGEAEVGRMSIEKVFKGDLEGSSKGQMLAMMTGVKESAGYVAMELVTGALHGRRGTFALQHSGTMNRGVPQLSVTVVPDSGTGELAGLSGRMTIDLSGGKHAYAFDYAIVHP